MTYISDIILSRICEKTNDNDVECIILSRKMNDYDAFSVALDV